MIPSGPVKMSDLRGVSVNASDGTLSFPGTISVNALTINGTVVVATPPGCVSAYAGQTAPSGWVLCDGQDLNRLSYADLFGVIGTTYGTTDDPTMFRLPNLNGKVVVGTSESDTEFAVLGETGGAKTHTLTVDEIPAHSHGLSDLGHTHTLSDTLHTHTYETITISTTTTNLSSSGGGGSTATGNLMLSFTESINGYLGVIQGAVIYNTGRIIGVDSSGNTYMCVVAGSNGGSGGDNDDVYVIQMKPDGTNGWVMHDTMYVNTSGNELFPVLKVDVASSRVYIFYQRQSLMDGSITLVLASIHLTDGSVDWVRDDILSTIDINTLPANPFNYPVVNIAGNYSNNAIEMDGSGNVYVAFSFNVNYTGPVGNVTWTYSKVQKYTSSNSFVWGTYISYPVTPSPGYGSYQIKGDDILFINGNLCVAVGYNQSLYLQFLSLSDGSLASQNNSITSTAAIYDNISLAKDSLNNLYVAFVTQGTVPGGTNTGSYDRCMAKINSSGVLQWIKQFTTLNAFGNEPQGVQLCLDVDSSTGTSYLTWASQNVPATITPQGGYDIVVAQINTEGTVHDFYATSVLNTSGADQYPSIAWYATGNALFMVHTSYSTSPPYTPQQVNFSKFTLDTGSSGGEGGTSAVVTSVTATSTSTTTESSASGISIGISTTGASVQSTGEGAAHNILQPYIALRYIIKY